MIKVKKEGQGVMFPNSFLEIFTKTNPVLHILTYGGAIALFIYLDQTDIRSFVSCAVAGVIAWTLVEYLIHRFLFHIPESRFQYLIHGIHHEFPRDKERLMMPPLPGILLTVFFYSFWYLFLGRTYTPSFMAGFIGGYMLYTFLHYIVHAWKPIPGIKFLWTHHLKHHNPVYDHTSYGVSSPFWDYVFGTMPDKKKAAEQAQGMRVVHRSDHDHASHGS
jgi:4-hydroxysphinganine ceramide fatty acyl 2-hydroxylase